MAEKDKERFVKVYSQGGVISSRIEVFVDTVTGVNYMFRNDGAYAGGLTPLLDKDGKPVITPIEDNSGDN